MAGSLLTITLNNSAATNVTVTLATDDYPAAKNWMQQLPRNGGFFSDDGNWHPVSSILTITVTTI
jgi:hypothetical protein